MKFIKILLVSLLYIFSSSVVRAVDLSVICNNSGCETSPYNGVALFSELEFPNYDIKPGDTILRRITVVNNSSDVCNLAFNTVSANQVGEVNLAEVLNTVIKDNSQNYFGSEGLGGYASDDQTLQSLFNIGQIGLGTIPGGQTKIYDWLVSIDTSVGNKYQKARIEFDFDMIFECDFKEIETGKKSSIEKIDPNCDDPIIDVKYQARLDGVPVKNVEVIFTYKGNTSTVLTRDDGWALTGFVYNGPGEIKATNTVGYPNQALYINTLDCPGIGGGGPTPSPVLGITTGKYLGAFTGVVEDLLDLTLPTKPVETAVRGEIKGESTCCPKICPEWWILLILQTLILSKYFLKKIKNKELGDWKLYTIIVVIGTLILHWLLHRLFVGVWDYEKNPIEDWFWLLAIINGLVLVVFYRWVNKDDKK